MRATALFITLAFGTAAAADPARIEAVEAHQRDDGWVISVTLLHTDTGWEDYADGWRVELPDGTVLAQRALERPHVTEQPFTRSKTGIAIPEGAETVHIRARTVTEGWDTISVPLKLPR